MSFGSGRTDLWQERLRMGPVELNLGALRVQCRENIGKQSL